MISCCAFRWFDCNFVGANEKMLTTEPFFTTLTEEMTECGATARDRSRDLVVCTDGWPGQATAPGEPVVAARDRESEGPVSYPVLASSAWELAAPWASRASLDPMPAWFEILVACA